VQQFDRDLVSALGITILSYSPLLCIRDLHCWVGRSVYTPLSTISVGMDISLLIRSFAVIIVEVGSLTVLYSGLSLSVKFMHLVYFFSGIGFSFIFLIIVIILIVRPFGLLGQPV
jgi:branched-chain amino acid transport system permease protein